MDEHVVVEHPLPYHITASTTQHSRKASTAVRADQSATTLASRQGASTLLQYCKQSTSQLNSAKSLKASTALRADQSAAASKQSWREPAHAVEHLYSTPSSQKERRNRSLPGLQEYTTIYELSQRWC